eukprot:scaffold597750_cov24-Prasinocladus_malaysianus.AAC.1
MQHWSAFIVKTYTVLTTYPAGDNSATLSISHFAAIKWGMFRLENVDGVIGIQLQEHHPHQHRAPVKITAMCQGCSGQAG